MEVVLNWKDDLSFTGSAPSGHSLNLSGHANANEKREGYEPIELAALALGGCTAMDVISILRKKQQEVTGFQVRVFTERRGEHPRVWKNAIINFIVRGKKIDPAAVARAIQLSSEKYCSVQNMLKATVPIETRYEIVEEAEHSPESIYT